MRSSGNHVQPCLRALLLSACLGGIPAVAFAEAQEHGPGQHGAVHGAGHGAGMQHGGDGQRGAGKHGGCGGRHAAGHGGERHGGKGGHGRSHLYSAHWKAALTDEQKQQLDRLHVEYAKIKHPAKARSDALKMELQALATANEVDQAAIDGKLDELLAVKRELLRANYGYLAAQRQVLTPEQQLSFDMEALHKGADDKKGHGGHH